MSANQRKDGGSAMTGEGASLELRGEGFPPGAAAEMAVLIARLTSPLPETPKRVRSQRVEEIPDVVVQSAFTLVEEEMRDDEAKFAQAAAAPPSGSDADRVRKIADAEENLERVLRSAEQMGFRLRIQVEQDPGWDLT